jgi:hypothetical protein
LKSVKEFLYNAIRLLMEISHAEKKNRTTLWSNKGKSVPRPRLKRKANYPDRP